MFKKLKLLKPFDKGEILTRAELRLVKGSDIRKYRDEKCYTQSYMASQLGIGQSAYQKIESGSIKISMERLIQIANILEQPVDVFLEDSKDLSQKVKINAKIEIAEIEYLLMQKIILQQEKRIAELESKLSLLQESNQ